MVPPAAEGDAQVSSCPSLHRLGLMVAKAGVVASLARSSTRLPRAPARLVQRPSPTTLARHSAAWSMTERNQTKPLCRAA